MAHKRDYYQVLGVSKNASPEEIKKAYRQAALKHHPDRNEGDPKAEESFKEAAEAYEVLSDPHQRARYDQFGHAGVTHGAGGGRPFQDMDDIFASFGDIFEDVFGMGGFGGFGPSRRGRSHVRRGRDLSVEMEIDFEEACFGVERTVEITRQETCEDCHGQGAAPGSERKTCPRCHGSGQVGRNQGFFTITATCNECRGSGSVVTEPCRTCRGNGRLDRHKKMTVKVPPGVDDGNRLVLQGEGDGGEGGGGPGDLYVFLRVRAHERFERDGTTIYSEEDISFVTAALGGEIEVDTLNGKTGIRVPKGTETGDTVIVEGAGVTELRSGKSKNRGDHVVRLVVRTPKHLTSKQEELLKQFASLSGETIKSPKKKKGFFGS